MKEVAATCKCATNQAKTTTKISQKPKRFETMTGSGNGNRKQKVSSNYSSSLLIE